MFFITHEDMRELLNCVAIVYFAVGAVVGITVAFHFHGRLSAWLRCCRRRV